MSGTFARWAGDTPLDGRGGRGRPALVPVTGVVDATSRSTASADDRGTLALVNDSAFGLSAAVFTDDLRAVTAAIETLDVGVLHINSETAGADPHVPFDGSKASAFGPKEQARAARELSTKTTMVYLKASTGVVP